LNIFLDIETVPEFADRNEYLKVKQSSNGQKDDLYYKFHYGSLNPHEGKVVLITYQVDDGQPQYLKQWLSNEQTILKKFFDIVGQKKTNQGEKTTLIGLNIAHFDLPFLFVRMLKNQIVTSFKTGHDPVWLYNTLMKFPYFIDLLQIHLPLNDFNPVGVTHDAIAKSYGFPMKGERGNTNIDRYYTAPEEIMKYVETEFIYPQLFSKISKDGLISKARFQEIVKELSAKREIK